MFSEASQGRLSACLTQHVALWLTQLQLRGQACSSQRRCILWPLRTPPALAGRAAAAVSPVNEACFKMYEDLSRLTFLVRSFMNYHPGRIRHVPCHPQRRWTEEKLGRNCLLHHFWVSNPIMTEGSRHFYHTQHTVLHACAKSLQTCTTLCDPADCSPPGNCVHGIIQARILEWGAMPSSSGPSGNRVSCASCIGRRGGFFTCSRSNETVVSCSKRFSNLSHHTLYLDALFLWTESWETETWVYIWEQRAFKTCSFHNSQRGQ